MDEHFASNVTKLLSRIYIIHNSMKKLFILIGILFFAGFVQAKYLHEYASFDARAEKAQELGLIPVVSAYTGDFNTNLALLEWYQTYDPQAIAEDIELGAEGVLLIAGT